MQFKKRQLEQRIEENNFEELEKKIEKEGMYFTQERNEAELLEEQGYCSLKFPEEYYVIIKKSLKNALGSPSSSDLSLLKQAKRDMQDILEKNFADKTINPEKSIFLDTIEGAYHSSLIMNLIPYSNNKPSQEIIEKLGLNNQEIIELYEKAMTIWSEKPTKLNLEGITSTIRHINWKGEEEEIELNSELFNNGTHYVLKSDFRKKIKKVQKEGISGEKYSEIEDQIIKYIQENCQDEIIKENATDCVREFMNLAGLYEQNSSLSLE